MSWSAAFERLERFSRPGPAQIPTIELDQISTVPERRRACLPVGYRDPGCGYHHCHALCSRPPADPAAALKQSERRDDRKLVEVASPSEAKGAK